ncbi:MAG: hypothetical protein FJ149_03030 [Euryarchaeota archaeon]|nr:hypothetical protein [Euryarchaeota archaeon]
MAMGAAGAALSLLWDVIYRGRPFSLQSIGPVKIVGMVAGLAIVNVGIWAGFALARRKRPVAGGIFGQEPPAGHPGLLFSGALLALSGLGGMLVSLLWDLIARGRDFSADAIGPGKVAGMLSGLALLAVGAALLALCLRRTGAAAKKAERPVPAAPAEPVEVPYALPVERARPPAAGMQPPEAIPVEESTQGAEDPGY